MGKIFQGPSDDFNPKAEAPVEHVAEVRVVYVDRPFEIIKEVKVPSEPQIVYVDRPIEVIKTVEVKVPEYRLIEVSVPAEPIIQIKEVIKEIEVPSAPQITIKKVYPIWLLVAGGLNLLLTAYLLLK